MTIDERWAAMYARLGFSAEDVKFYETLPLSERQSSEMWREIDAAVCADIKARAAQNTDAKVWVNGVVPDGMDAIHNPVDGKMYDSRSRYMRKLKETGHHVYEGTPSDKKPLGRGDHNVFKELKQACEQHGVY